MTLSEEEKPALEWLARQYPDSPNKRLKEWFACGRITINGKVITKPHLRFTNPGKALKMTPALGRRKVLSRRMPVRIHAQVNLLYIDEALAIVNKGPGLLSVPLPGKHQPSALSVLKLYLQDKGTQTSKRNAMDSHAFTPLPVHRLDQYTSGLLCFAMHPEAREHLIKQVRDHSFLREYLALGDGKLRQRKGLWKNWLRLDEQGMKQFAFDVPTKSAVEATSLYEVIDEITWSTKDGRKHTVSRLRLRLQTGLKHQLRIHAAQAGIPLLGDRHYHPDFKKAADAGAGPPYGCKRQALHASSIGFIHPDTGKMKRFNSKFPRDLTIIEEALREKQAGD